MFSNIPTGYDFDLILLAFGLIGVGIASKGNFKSICKKLKKSDARLIIIMLILEMVFTIALTLIESSVFGLNIDSNPFIDQSQSLITYIGLIFDLFGEELFKLIGIFIFSYITYKITSNRKLSISIGVLLSLTFFGIMHIPVYGSIFHSIVIIGYGTIFTTYTYLKTKNIFVSYLTHLIYDVTCIILATLPF